MGKKTINNYGNYAEENNGEMKFIPTNSDDGVKWYKEWWFISLVIAIIGTVTFYFNFQSIGLSIGLGIILFLICLFLTQNVAFLELLM